MDTVPKLIEFHSRSLPLFQPVNGLAYNLLIHLMYVDAVADSGKQRNRQFAAQMLLKVGYTL
jgi:hypothetical protein